MNKVYPTILVGTVNKDYFDADQLQVEFVVSEEDGAGIDQPQTVPIEELWPTKKQENDMMMTNAYDIAHCIDLLRYLNP